MVSTALLQTSADYGLRTSKSVSYRENHRCPRPIERKRMHTRDSHLNIIVSKVPQVTLAFWIIKILATTLGETGGDTVSMTMDLGYLTGTVIFLSALIVLATLQIRALTTRDRQGGDSTLNFTNLKENQGISDKTFAFRIPRGVDVISDDGSRN